MKHFCLSDYTGKDFYVMHDMRRASDSAYSADCYEILYIAHGTGIYEIKGWHIPATEGDIFFSCPKTSHKLRPDHSLRGIEIYCCYFTEKAIENVKKDLMKDFSEFTDLCSQKISLLNTIDTENREIRDILIRMIDEQISMPQCFNHIISSYLSILLVKFLRAFKTYDFEKTYSHNMTVDTAIRYIHSKLYAKVSLADIAGYLRVSPSYICRLFKKHLGMTTVQFINFLRIEKIKDILQNTDRPIDRVTEMFLMDSDYLKQLFKRETGMTIQEYHDQYNFKHNPVDKK